MKDARGREIKYLRVSVTDRCNLRCKYCMPNGIECVEHKDILSFEEIRQIAACGAGLGITKIRLTGGEPLARKGCPELIRMLKEIPGIEKIAMTTNGTLVRAILPELVEAGLDEINISLDTLDARTFAAITGQDLLPEVLLAIDAALAAGLKVKVNAVSMPDTDWKRLITLAKDKPVDGTRRDAVTKIFWKRYAVNFLSFRPMTAYTGPGRRSIIRFRDIREASDSSVPCTESSAAPATGYD